MKIGILTYHRVVNDGSILQTYCGQMVIASLFPGARVEIIDYSSGTLRKTEYKKLIGKRPPFFHPQAFSKMKSIHRFIKEYIVLSSQSCNTDDLEKALKFIVAQNYAAVFVGSDTIWEARHSIYVPCPPNIYYLPGIKTTKKIAYSASSDPLHLDFTSDQKLMGEIASSIQDFDLITVRDQPTRNHLLRLGVIPGDIHFMPDPTLQCDFEELVEKPIFKKKQPWAGIGFGGAVKKAATSQLARKGYAVVDLSNFTLNDEPIPGARQSVNIRLGVFSMLDFLITDRYHSSIFTLKLSGSPIIFVESAQKWPDHNSKGRDLFQRLGVEQMVWRYDGQNIPIDLIEQYLMIWESLKINFKESLATIQSVAGNQLKMIKKTVEI